MIMWPWLFWPAIAMGMFHPHFLGRPLPQPKEDEHVETREEDSQPYPHSHFSG